MADTKLSPSTQAVLAQTAQADQAKKAQALAQANQAVIDQHAGYQYAQPQSVTNPGALPTTAMQNADNAPSIPKGSGGTWGDIKSGDPGTLGPFDGGLYGDAVRQQTLDKQKLDLLTSVGRNAGASAPTGTPFQYDPTASPEVMALANKLGLTKEQVALSTVPMNDTKPSTPAKATPAVPAPTTKVAVVPAKPVQAVTAQVVPTAVPTDLPSEPDSGSSASAPTAFMNPQVPASTPALVPGVTAPAPEKADQFGDFVKGVMKNGGTVLDVMRKIAQAYGAGATGHPELASYGGLAGKGDETIAQHNIAVQQAQGQSQIENQNAQAKAQLGLSQQQMETNVRLEQQRLDQAQQGLDMQKYLNTLDTTKTQAQKDQFAKDLEFKYADLAQRKKETELQLAQLQRGYTNAGNSKIDSRF